ncbi:MAG: hypothetical protein GXO83_08705 [Chlorobi bacterium]|nr:hypothetical protein [Chlorobiota bacterium]
MLKNKRSGKHPFRYLIISGVVTGAAVWVVYSGLHRNSVVRYREKYEAFLLENYRDIAGLTKSGQDVYVRPDSPELAAYQDFLMTVDPATGIVPKERLTEAKRVLKGYKTKKGTEQWEFSWTSRPSDMGGRTRALMFDPADSLQKKLWAGSVTGGLWVNEDITSPFEKWHPVNDFLENLSISCMAFDPQNPNVLFAGTGEAQTAVTIYRESSGLGSGILKSSDGGKTWDFLSSTAGFAYVTDIVTRVEQDTTVVYAAVVSGYYKESYHYSQPSDGLYRSSDGGVSWQQVLPKIPGGKKIFAPADIEIGPDGRIFVGTMRNLNGQGGGTILYSDNGTGWQIYDSIYQEIIQLPDSKTNVPGRVILATAPSDSARVYAVVAGGGPTLAGFIFYKAYTILRSDDRGVTWKKITMPADDGSWAMLAWHALTLAVDPNDPNTIYAGGLDQHKSSDGGQTWHKISDWFGMYDGGGSPYIHADQHKVVFRNHSSDEILFATDGGIFYTQNGTADYPDFVERNDAYNTLQFYTCAIDPVAGSDHFLAGTQDNGTIFYKGIPASLPDMISGGDGAYCFFDTDQADYFITSVYYNRYYVYQTISALSTSMKHYIDNYYSGVFINPADYDSRLNKLYANAVSFEGNFADQILRIDNMVTAPEGHFLTMSTGTQVYFSAIKVSPFSPQDHTTLFAGTQSGKLFRAENADMIPQVTEIGDTDFPAANISCINIGSDKDHILVTFSNYGVPSIWETVNGGTSWKNVEGDLPDMPVRWILYNPLDDRSALIATELGIWICDNLDAGSVSWYPVNTGMANVRTDMLQYRPSDGLILAATHGRGIFTTSGLSSGIRKSQDVNALRISAYPNPAEDELFVSTEIPGRYIAGFYTVSGKLIRQQNIIIASPGTSCRLDVSGIPGGIVILKLDGVSLSGHFKIFIKH